LSRVRILLLGSTGFIGRAVARSALELGHFVCGISRTAAVNQGALEQDRAERTPPEPILDIIRSRRIDTVIDAAAFTLETSKQLVGALDGSVARYTLLSSGDVYRNYGVIHRREAGPAIVGSLDEQSPLRTSRFPYRGPEPRAANDPRRWLDDYDKIPIEACVRSMAKTRWTILRLPMVYGQGDPLARFEWVVAPLRTGAAKLSIPRSWSQWHTTYGYVDDIAAGIVLAATHGAAAQTTFNLGEAEPATHLDWARKFAAASRWPGTIEESNDPALPLARAIAQMDLSVPLVMSTGRIRQVLGYGETVPLEDALKRTLATQPRT
jgi:nucleoside-diphosphate-sugar epimerase